MTIMSSMVLRNFRSGDEQVFFSLVNTVFRNLKRLRKLSFPSFNPRGFFFIVEEKGLPVGYICVINLPADKVAYSHSASCYR